MGFIADDALFGPETVTARVVTESVLLLGGPRALLMQIAEPAVAAGVAEHSEFEADPFGRLVRTLDAMTTIAFGTPEEAEAVLEGLRRVHDAVTGALDDGSPYEANDPELLFWVHATLVDTVLEVERRYLGYLTPEDREQYYEESKRLARAFGVPDELIPPDLTGFLAYVDHKCRTVEVTDTAVRLSRAILSPPVPLVPGVAWEPIRLVTIDMLPRPLREAYGLRWDTYRKRLLRSSQAGVRLVLPRIPRLVRNFPTTARRRLARAS